MSSCTLSLTVGISIRELGERGQVGGVGGGDNGERLRGELSLLGGYERDDMISLLIEQY